jgi:8-oxo-dGTP pyrophosphatase MutT (NUDIX family)
MSEYIDWLNTKVLQKARVVDAAGNILALKRTETGPAVRPGKWDLPGGSIGPEDLQDLPDGTKPHLAAIGREVLEETGLVAVTVRPVFFDSWTFQRSVGTVLGLAIGYEVTVEGVKPPVQRSDEHTAELWGTRDELLALDFGDDGGLHPAVLRT